MERDQLNYQNKEKVELAEKQLQRLKAKAKKTAAELENAQKTFTEAIFESFKINETSPLSDKAEEILQYAKSEGADPTWLFQVLNSTACLILKYPSFSSIEKLPQEAFVEFSDVLPLSDQNFTRATRQMYFGTYDDPSTNPELELAGAEKNACLYEDIYLIPQERRLSIAYKWIRQNSRLLRILNDLDHEQRQKYLNPKQ